MYLMSKKETIMCTKDVQIGTSNPLFSPSTKIWDLLWAMHCSRSLDVTVNKTKIQSRPQHHCSKEQKKEKNPYQVQGDNEGRKISHSCPFGSPSPLSNCYL